MVKYYNSYSNPMMRRPILTPEILELLRNRQNQLTGELAELELFAKENNIPVIPHETVAFFQFILPLLQPKKILEVGTAIGFSTMIMADSVPNAEITTLERFEEMLTYARKNLGDKPNIKIVEGDAAETLPELPDKYDFIFMDSTKTQYIKFLPHLLDHLSERGVIMIDDIFQAGDIMKDVKDIDRRQRSMHNALNKLIDTVHEDENLESSILPLGDGLLMIRRNLR